MEQLNLYDINFPVYGITNDYRGIWKEHNVTYIRTDSGTYVLDNKNMDGNTVGKRRLKIKTSQLYIPRKVYYTLGQMLQSKYKIYMDNYGTVFKYKKTGFVPLHYFRVQEVFQTLDGECVMHVPQIQYSYKINCRKAYSINYIGLLVTDFGYIPYDFSDTYKSPTRRKI